MEEQRQELVKAEAFANEQLPNAEAILVKAQGLMVTNNDECAVGKELLKTIKRRTIEIENGRKKITDPLDQLRKEIVKLADRPLSILLKAKGITTSNVIDYEEKQTNKRREEQRKLEAEAKERADKEKEKLLKQAKKSERNGDKETATALRGDAKKTFVPAPVISDSTPETKGVSGSVAYGFEVIDEESLLKYIVEEANEYIKIDLVMIGKEVRAKKGKVKIPGIRTFPKPGLSVRL